MGARGGIRTRTPFRTMDFESIASAIPPPGPAGRSPAQMPSPSLRDPSSSVDPGTTGPTTRTRTVTVEKGIPSLGHHRWPRPPGGGRTRRSAEPVGSRRWNPRRTRWPDRRQVGVAASGCRRASGTLYERWSQLGRRSAPAVQVAAVALWSVDLPFRRPVATARGVHRARPLAMVQIMGQAGDAAVEGWGECAALADTTYDAEDVATSAAALEEIARPRPPPPFRRAPGGRIRPARTVRPRRHPERRRRRSAGLRRPGDGRGRRPSAGRPKLTGSIPRRGGSVGGARGGGGTGRARRRHWSPKWRPWPPRGTRRVKIKIGPGWDLEPLEALRRLRSPASASRSTPTARTREEDLDHLGELDRFGLLCIEQPFDPDDLAAHARLATRSSTPICLDEGVDSPASVARALDVGACSVVCVKPARLGGLGAALRGGRCAVRPTGVPLWMGGMFESGYARGVNTTIGRPARVRLARRPEPGPLATWAPTWSLRPGCRDAVRGRRCGRPSVRTGHGSPARPDDAGPARRPPPTGSGTPDR